LALGDGERARRYIDRGLSINGRHSKLLALQQRLETGLSADNRTSRSSRLFED
jgi:hypothetical protein